MLPPYTARDYGDATRGYGKVTRGYGNAARGYGNATRGYGDAARINGRNLLVIDKSIIKSTIIIIIA